MENSFVMRPKRSDKKNNKSIIMTIRISHDLKEQYDELAIKSSRSRNEVLIMALQYALDNLEFIPDDENLVK